MLINSLKVENREKACEKGNQEQGYWIKINWFKALGLYFLGIGRYFIGFDLWM